MFVYVTTWNGWSQEQKCFVTSLIDQFQSPVIYIYWPKIGFVKGQTCATSNCIIHFSHSEAKMSTTNVKQSTVFKQ